MEQALLKPSARRRPGYQVITVKQRAGPSVRGFLRNESLYDIQVQGFDGRLYLLSRGEVTAIAREASSYMPALKSSTTDFENLLAYLSFPNTDSPPPAAAELPGAVPWSASSIRRPATGPLTTAN